ncbi:hypothetical protein D3C87_1966380 [compost metagenome]
MVEVTDDLNVLVLTFLDVATGVGQGVDHVILIAVQRLQEDGGAGARGDGIQIAQGVVHHLAIPVLATRRCHGG